MDWLEISLRVEAHLAETVADRLAPLAYQGVSIARDDKPTEAWDRGNIPDPTHLVVSAYLPQGTQQADAQATIDAALAGLPVDAPRYRTVAETDWAEAWKAHYHPVRLGRRIVVRPLWEPFELGPHDVEIALDPGMAFGTGTHPTTQLCLSVLEDVMRPGDRVLDLGCGSGILAIGAVKLGARSVFAIDIDPVATEAAAENIERNGTTHAVELATGGLPDVLAREETFNLALVNILAHIIIDMAENGLERVIRPGGRAIFTGMTRAQAPKVQAALEAAGLRITGQHMQGDWVLFEAARDT